MASVPQTKISSARQGLYRRMDKHNTAPLWEVLHGLIPDEPVTRCKPYLWKYKDVRRYITEAGKLITAKEAIRSGKMNTSSTAPTGITSAATRICRAIRFTTAQSTTPRA